MVPALQVLVNVRIVPFLTQVQNKLSILIRVSVVNVLSALKKSSWVVDCGSGVLCLALKVSIQKEVILGQNSLRQGSQCLDNYINCALCFYETLAIANA